MANLKYITKDNTSLHGKSKIYFCCHPDELEKYLYSVANDIFEHVDCSVWYGSADDERNEEYLSFLLDMQLFVIPVTSKFLTSKNYALEKEFDFAVKNRIPILPLMQEGGIVGLFNEKCGDIQFLDKNDSDKTALSFSKKLGDFLSSVIFSDEMTKKIRDAFDAYIFLSYRKKDRAYAQELMRLIHKNDFCRDIAIWYDEFLIPGENFNSAIEEAIKKSSLFVMAVTPNLVNENNYIVKYEYPLAKGEKKDIIPTEMLPTDRDKLNELFPDIPECTDARNAEMLANSLLDSIRRTSVGEHNNSPEHTFFIGLAYLGGIDVEVDREKGVSLITSAADQGLPEAMEKLIDMYTWGTGVRRDRKIALYWAKKLVKTRKKLYLDEKTSENANAYLYAYRYLISVVPDINHYPLKRKLARKAERLSAVTSDRHLLKYSYAYLMIEPLRSIELKINQLEVLAFELCDYDLFDSLLLSYCELADRYEEKGNYERALDLYLKGIETAYIAKEKLGESGEIIENTEELLLGLSELGISGDGNEAELAVQALDSLLTKHQDDSCAKYYAKAERIFAQKLFYRKDFEKAAEHAAIAIQIQNRLSTKYPQDDLDEKFETLFLLMRINNRKSCDTADHYYREAFGVCEKMEQFAKDADEFIEIAKLCIRLIQFANQDDKTVLCHKASENLLKANKPIDTFRRYKLKEIAELHQDLGYTLGIAAHYLMSIEFQKYRLACGQTYFSMEGIALCYRELAKLTKDSAEKEKYHIEERKYTRMSKNFLCKIYYHLKRGRK